MTASADKGLGMVDAVVFEAGHIQDVVAGQTLGIDHRIGLHSGLQSGEQGWTTGLGDWQRIDFATALEDAKHTDFTRRTASAFMIRLFGLIEAGTAGIKWEEPLNKGFQGGSQPKTPRNGI
jgi:hypothetical protein